MANCLRTLPVLILLAVAVNVIAQPSLQKMQGRLLLEKQNSASSFLKFEQSAKMPAQAGLLLSADRAISKANLAAWLADKLELRPGIDEFRQRQQPIDYFGSQVNKLQQYYKGIKVEHGVISAAGMGDKIRLLQLEFYPVADALPTTPVITAAAALSKAMDFVGAKQYAWQQNPNDIPDLRQPHAELVIVEDIFNNEKGKMCLAYKFDVFATEPASRQYIYVDAATGKVVFADSIIKHINGNNRSHGHTKAPLSQSPASLPEKKFVQAPLTPPPVRTNSYEQATGYTMYSGNQQFTTEKMSPTLYRLRGQHTINNTPYETLNFNHKLLTTVNPPVDITDFTDNDNAWDETSYIMDTTYAALDIQWGTEQVLDYWWDTHARISFDNSNSKITSYFHYGLRFDGAFWNGQVKSMFYGDGSQDGLGFNATTSLDIVSHELGHGICDYTAGLVYKRESGALSEGFSDIWGACVDNFVNKRDPNLFKQPFLLVDEAVEAPGRDCLRDMKNPRRWYQPDSYQDTAHFWFDVNIENCPVPIDAKEPMGNDFCGVHNNSGVLNKWFYLVTQGDTMTSANGQLYTIDSMGFDKTERIAYYTEMILTPNSGFEAARIASLNAIQLLDGTFNNAGVSLADTANVSKAWAAVGVTTDSIYNMGNTPIFATNQFTSIATGQRGFIWAGTSNNGLYKFNGKIWQKAPNLTNHNIAQILPDRDGGIWIAQYGRTGTQALLGGIGYYQDTSFTYQQFSNAEGVPTRNVKGIFINNELNYTQKYRRVWASCFGDVTSGNNRPGAVTRGLENPVSPEYFDKIVNGVYQVNGFCQAIGGNKDEVWVFANSNTPAGVNQILRYRTADTTFIGAIDNSNTPLLSTNFLAKAIYYDEIKQRWWIGLQSGGMLVRDSATHSWMSANYPAIFPPGTIVSNNAITGDTRGNIYVGTNQGLVYFGSPDAAIVLNPLDETQYRRYTKANDNLPSDTVRSVAVDYRAGRLLVATENGIAFRFTLCKDCANSGPVYTVTPGNWSSPGIWSGGQVPGINSNVVIKHAVAVTQDANCNSLKMQSGGAVNVNAGVKLNIESTSPIAD